MLTFNKKINNSYKKNVNIISNVFTNTRNLQKKKTQSELINKLRSIYIINPSEI